MKGKKISYSATELTWVKDNCTLVGAELHKQFCVKFNRSDVSKINLNSLRKRNGWKTGRTGHFEKGHIPSPNSGTKGPNKTSFKKGHVSANHRPVGSERICSKDGFILVKVAETNPYTGHKTRFRFKHHIVWEAANGSIVPGTVIRFKDGNKLNCVLENLECFDRAENLQLNRLDVNNQPVEIRDPLKSIVRLEHKIKKVSEVSA
jgi:hypothetical protein